MAQYLFSEQGMSALAPFCREGTLFAFDFDGTLASLRGDSMNRAMGKSVQALMNDLAMRAPVAIITGRSLARLEGVLGGFTCAHRIGNHGAEGYPLPLDISPEALAPTLTAWEAALTTLMEEGMRMEVKSHTLTVHYRHHPHPRRIRRELLARMQALSPPARVLDGKFVFNLIPGSLPGKGAALQALMEAGSYERAFFIGDDATDEDVFRLRDARVFGVRIGSPKRTFAPYFLRRQSEVPALLDAILQAFAR